MMNWHNLADPKHKLFMNTPTTYSIYMCGLVLEHMLEQGGIPYYTDLAQKKSQIIYNFLDNSKNNGEGHLYF
jgi:phosphoserine aminotransferase